MSHTHGAHGQCRKPYNCCCQYHVSYVYPSTVRARLAWGGLVCATLRWRDWAKMGTIYKYRSPKTCERGRMAISQTLCLCHSGKSKFPYSCQFGTKPTKYESLGTALNHQQGELPAAPYKIKSRHYYFPGEARPPSTRRAARNSKPYDAQAILPSAIDHVSSFQTRNFNAAEPFPSGTETHDMLERLCEGTYGFYESKRRGRRCATVDLAATAAEASSPDPATIAASTSSNTETPEAAAVSPSPTDPIAAAGFGETRSDMPEGWFPPYILLAAAWSPWSGPSTPAEWRNLDPSSGGCKRGRSRLEGEEEEEGGGGGGKKKAK